MPYPRSTGLPLPLLLLPLPLVSSSGGTVPVVVHDDASLVVRSRIGQCPIHGGSFARGRGMRPRLPSHSLDPPGGWPASGRGFDLRHWSSVFFLV